MILHSKTGEISGKNFTTRFCRGTLANDLKRCNLGCVPKRSVSSCDVRFRTVRLHWKATKARGGWRLIEPKIKQKSPPELCHPSPIGRHRKKGARKRPESLVREGFPCANPFSKPSKLLSGLSQEFQDGNHVTGEYFVP